MSYNKCSFPYDFHACYIIPFVLQYTQQVKINDNLTNHTLQRSYQKYQTLILNIILTSLHSSLILVQQMIGLIAEFELENKTSSSNSVREDNPLKLTTTAGIIETRRASSIKLTTFIEFSIRFLLRTFLSLLSSVCALTSVSVL